MGLGQFQRTTGFGAKCPPVHIPKSKDTMSKRATKCKREAFRQSTPTKKTEPARKKILPQENEPCLANAGLENERLPAAPTIGVRKRKLHCTPDTNLKAVRWFGKEKITFRAFPKIPKITSSMSSKFRARHNWTGKGCSQGLIPGLGTTTFPLPHHGYPETQGQKVTDTHSSQTEGFSPKLVP